MPQFIESPVDPQQFDDLWSLEGHRQLQISLLQRPDQGDLRPVVGTVLAEAVLEIGKGGVSKSELGSNVGSFTLSTVRELPVLASKRNVSNGVAAVVFAPLCQLFWIAPVGVRQVGTVPEVSSKPRLAGGMPPWEDAADAKSAVIWSNDYIEAC